MESNAHSFNEFIKKKKNFFNDSSLLKLCMRTKKAIFSPFTKQACYLIYEFEIVHFSNKLTICLETSTFCHNLHIYKFKI